MAQRKSSSRRNPRRKTASRRTARRSTSTRSDAISLLKDDHQRVRSMFERFERTRGDAQKERLAGQICDELKVHAQIEEEIFYPAVREAIEDDDLMNEAQVEHNSAKELIAQIEASSPSDERYDALVKVLGEYVLHHVKEEEREMFKQARGAEVDLADLGEQLKERKRVLTSGSAGERIAGRLASAIGSRSR
jgi:hemerythrin superfamily protein